MQREDVEPAFRVYPPEVAVVRVSRQRSRCARRWPTAGGKASSASSSRSVARSGRLGDLLEKALAGEFVLPALETHLARDLKSLASETSSGNYSNLPFRTP